MDRPFRSMSARRSIVAGAIAIMLVSAAPTAAQDDSDKQSVQQVSAKMRKAYKAADYKKALELAGKLRELRPKAIDPIYDTACFHCLLGEKDKAFEWLEKAVDAGYRDADHMVNDHDLRTIRGEKRFRALVRRVRDRNRKAAKPGDKKAEPKKTDAPKTEPKPRPKAEPSRPAMSEEEARERINELTAAVIEASNAGKNRKALDLAEQALAIADVGLTNYNVACMHARLNHKAMAIKFLEVAIDKGMGDLDMVEQIEGDSDFDNIREEAGYKDAVAKAKGGQTERTGRVSRPRGEGRSEERRDAEPSRPAMSEEEAQARVTELTGQVIEASNAGKKQKALDLAEQALAIADVGLTNYNVACMHSLLNHKAKAIKFLEIAVERGMGGIDMVEQIEGDSDFDNIRKEAGYKDAVAAAKRGQTERTGRDSRPSGAAEPAAAAEGNGEKVVEPQWKVTLPKDLDKTAKAPLIVALHHYHGTMERTTDRWQAAAAKVGAILLTPQGTHDLGNGQYHWGRDLDKIENDVMDAIDMVLDKHRIDSKKIILAGFSQGGWATWGLALRNPDVFAGLIPICGRFEPESEAVFQGDDLKGARVFIMLGENERDEVLSGNKDAARRFRKVGATVRTKIYEGIGHGYPEDTTDELVRALRFVLEG